MVMRVYVYGWEFFNSNYITCVYESNRYKIKQRQVQISLIGHKFVEYMHNKNEPYNMNNKSISESSSKRIKELDW